MFSGFRKKSSNVHISFCVHNKITESRARDTELALTLIRVSMVSLQLCCAIAFRTTETIRQWHTLLFVCCCCFVSFLFFVVFVLLFTLFVYHDHCRDAFFSGTPVTQPEHILASGEVPRMLNAGFTTNPQSSIYPTSFVEILLFRSLA